jgi:hypothetical protein
MIDIAISKHGFLLSVAAKGHVRSRVADRDAEWEGAEFSVKI